LVWSLLFVLVSLIFWYIYIYIYISFVVVSSLIPPFGLKKRKGRDFKISLPIYSYIQESMILKLFTL
jgi:hypothetical protein